jgi:hypothetical protein
MILIKTLSKWNFGIELGARNSDRKKFCEESKVSAARK